MKRNLIVIVLILLSTLNFSSRFGYEISSNLINSSVLLRLSCITLLGIICIINNQKILNLIFSYKFLLFVYLLITYFTLSSIWSVNSFWTLYRGLEYGIMFSSCLLYIKSENSFNSFLNKVFLLINSLIFVSYIDTYFLNLSNIFSLNAIQCSFPRLNPGTLGFLSLVGISYRIFFKNLIYKKDLFWTSFYFITLILSQNRSSLIASIFIFVLYYFSIRNFSKNILTIFGITGLFLIFTLTNSFEVFLLYLTKGQNLDLLQSLSTRTINWNFSLNYMSQVNIFYKLFGLGAYAGVRFLVAPSAFFITKQGISPTTTDNLWLETYVNNGIIGIVFTFLFFIYLFWQVFKIKGKNLKLFNTSLIIIYLIRGLFTANIFVHSNLILIFLIISSSGLKIKTNNFLK